MKFTTFYKIGTTLKDLGERHNIPALKSIGYRLRGHVA